MSSHTAWVARVATIWLVYLLSHVVASPVSEWLNIAQTTVRDVGVEHQQAARLYATLATGTWTDSSGF